MAISSIKCPECGGDKTISSGGNKYVCQYCGATFVNASETIAPAVNTPPTVNCQYCGGEIVMGAQLTFWMVWPAVIIAIICTIQAISYLCMSNQAFAVKYH